LRQLEKSRADDEKSVHDEIRLSHILLHKSEERLQLVGGGGREMMGQTLEIQVRLEDKVKRSQIQIAQ
jgi:hypothetical protein